MRIGFEEANYTFSEPASSPQVYDIYLAKEDNVMTEQTFNVLVDVSAQALPPSSSLQTASIGSDHLLDGSNHPSLIVTFPPSALRLSFTVTILPDNVAEGDEGFIASSTSSQFQGAPRYLTPNGLAEDSLIVIRDAAHHVAHCFMATAVKLESWRRPISSLRLTNQ